MFSDTFKKELSSDSFDKLWSLFENIRDNMKIENKENIEVALRQIEELLLTLEASENLMHYYYSQFDTFLDYEEKFAAIGRHRVKRYVDKTEIDFTREGGVHYKFS